MRSFLPLLLVLPTGATAQTIDLDWPNMPCATLLHCDSGCTACNMAVNSSAVFNGTGLAHLGVDVCPLADGGGDNVLASYGWTAGIDTARSLFLSAIALQPLHIDSVVIRHRSSSDGPNQVLVSLAVNNAPAGAVAEFSSSETEGETTLTDLGTVAADAGMAYGFLQIHLQPYGSNAGAWYLDEIRIVATPATPTGVIEPGGQHAFSSPATIDLLGRPVGNTAVAGAYLATDRRVFVP